MAPSPRPLPTLWLSHRILSWRSRCWSWWFLSEGSTASSMYSTNACLYLRDGIMSTGGRERGEARHERMSAALQLLVWESIGDS